MLELAPPASPDPNAHVVLLGRAYLDMVLAGHKRLEARLSSHRIVPFGRVAPGDVLWFRAVGGGYAARAVASDVHSFESLRPADVHRLRCRFGPLVTAPAGFWQARRRARYATFIGLDRVEPVAGGPALAKKPGDRRAWIVLGPAGGLSRAAPIAA
ncbi:MAG: hypothetical protein KDA05_07300 [Phycisphaerales bacterium]|nr:hypothetical protein [Phycisphaerales bacterium]